MSTQEKSSNYAAEHGYTVKAYIVGFLLSIVLTLIPFTLVAEHYLPEFQTKVALIVFALIQLFVQVVFFLHLTTKPQERWNLMAFLFTILVVVILVFGSIWIMVNMNMNMMLPH